MKLNQVAIRRATAILLVLWVIGLVASYVARQMRRTPALEAIGVGAQTDDGAEPAVRVHKGFVYSDTVGIEPNFRIAARETVEFASGRFELRDVEVTLYNAGEVAYGMVADTARLDPGLREAEATGHAQLSLGSGIAVRAKGFTLRGAERTFESAEAVAFAGHGWGGTTGRVHGSLVDNSLELTGGVSVVFRGATSTTALLAQRASYRRRQALVEFPDGLELLQADLRAETPRASLVLAAAEGDLRRLVLEEPVTITGRLADGSEVLFRTGMVEIDGVGEGRFRFHAQGETIAGWAVLRWHDRSGAWRELAAYRLAGEGGRGELEWIEAQGLACASEFRPGSSARHVESQNLRIEFTEGSPGSVAATTDVRLDDGPNWAEGATFLYSTETQTYSLRGTATQRVRFGGAEFRATSDSVEGRSNGGVVARGRVAGSLDRGSVLGGEAETVRFAGDSATSSGAAGGTIALEGDARVWQQERLIRADRLEYDRGRETIRGAGDVITIATFGTGAEGGAQAKVRSRALTYDRKRGEASYDGDVELTDPRASVRCQRMVARMGANGEIERAVLAGGVVIRDTATAREVEGQRAEFDPAADVLDIWGMPVLAKEPSGNQLKASHLKWYRATGTFVVVGEEDNPSEALYHAGSGGLLVPATPRPPGRRP